MTEPQPSHKRAKMKVTAPATAHAADLLTHLLGDGRTKLAADPGTVYAEKIAGHQLLAYRLNCGGIGAGRLYGQVHHTFPEDSHHG